MINFNVPPFTGKEMEYIKQAVDNQKICGDGPFTKKCSSWLEEQTGSPRVLLTTSCSHALELSALLLDIKEGDEVIVPSYTFVSTANAFALRGARLVFVDIRPDTMNIDENLIEEAITERTKAIAVVHYAGVACEMDKICEIARKHGLAVVEDNAQGLMSTYKGRALGTFGDFGCISFHETKNFSMGEGGALQIGDTSYVERAEIFREKGTDRSKYFRGQVDKYRWQEYGSSYLPSELNAAYLYAQLELAKEITETRLSRWEQYKDLLTELAQKERIELPYIPEECTHNAHMFYIKTKDMEERSELIRFMKENDVLTVFHYIPLHSAPAGLKYGRFFGEDRYTTKESERLLRLPMFYTLTEDQVTYICEKVKEFYAIH